jgi:hypothetical protein
MILIAGMKVRECLLRRLIQLSLLIDQLRAAIADGGALL